MTFFLPLSNLPSNHLLQTTVNKLYGEARTIISAPTTPAIFPSLDLAQLGGRTRRVIRASASPITPNLPVISLNIEWAGVHDTLRDYLEVWAAGQAHSPSYVPQQHAGSVSPQGYVSPHRAAEMGVQSQVRMGMPEGAHAIQLSPIESPDPQMTYPSGDWGDFYANTSPYGQ